MSRSVVFATISLHNMAGGLERNIIRIANYLAERGYNVSLLSFDLPEAVSFYPIDAKVTWHKVGRTQPHGKISFADRISLLKRIRKCFGGNPTTLIVFHHGILLRLLLGSALKNVKTICSERSALTIYDHVSSHKWNLNFLLMFLCSKILVQFGSYIKDYPLPLRPRMASIPNVVEPVSLQAKPDTPDGKGRYTLLAVGRLCDQKNYAPLIQAYAKLSDKFADWDLKIIGDGGFRPQLEAQIKQAGLENRIFMPGTSQNMEALYLQSHLYVMPSKWEGFPNALAEAMAHGLPVIGYKGCAGVRDLIDEGKTGLLADGNGDAQTLGLQLEKLMSDATLRVSMGSAAAQSMRQYLPEKIYPQWERLLEDL